MPPIYAPEVAARTIAWAAEHDRREVWVGRPTVKTIIGQRLVPGFIDHYLAHKGFNAQQSDEPLPTHRPDNLYEPVDEERDFGADGHVSRPGRRQPADGPGRAPRSADRRRARRVGRLGGGHGDDARRSRVTVLGRVTDNLRHGRAQRLLSAATAASALPLGVEIYVNHYGGSFGNRWMWSPVLLSPALSAAGVAGLLSERAARTVLPAMSAVFAIDGAAGVYFHLRGIARKPGGFREASYNLVMGPPALAPGSLAMVGGLGLMAAVMGREQ